jgi:phosphatidylserine/phosphatidylglycerophosphate/cardiolipin synthase-like enzyme
MTQVMNMIQGATKSIDLVMYELEDTQVESALVSAEKRDVAVRVLLNEGYYGAQPSKESAAAYQYLQSGEVPVRWAPSYFALTHQKTLIVDGNQALIMTFNLTSQYYSTSRDFGVVDKDQADVSAIEDVFNDDWQGTRDTASQGDDLVWSPGADTIILSMINNSRKSLYIENEEMSDASVVDALIAATKRGVTVEVVMTDSSDWNANFTRLKAAGAGVRTYAASASLYIHAKIILADGTSVLVGSQNFSASSLKDNRELGIVLSDTGILNSLSSTFQSDWNGGISF